MNNDDNGRNDNMIII